MKAILYRPSTNKIINVETIYPSQQSETASSTVSASPRISYYNGSSVAGLAAATEKTVQLAHPDFQTTFIGSASKLYKKTLVIDLSGNYAPQAASLSILLKGATSTLPLGEVAPADTDILIISGK